MRIKPACTSLIFIATTSLFSQELFSVFSKENKEQEVWRTIPRTLKYEILDYAVGQAVLTSSAEKQDEQIKHLLLVSTEFHDLLREGIPDHQMPGIIQKLITKNKQHMLENNSARSLYLVGVDLNWRTLKDFTFESCLMRNANLSGATLNDVKVLKCNLSGANMRGLEVYGGAISSSILDGADLSYTTHKFTTKEDLLTETIKKLKKRAVVDSGHFNQLDPIEKTALHSMPNGSDIKVKACSDLEIQPFVTTLRRTKITGTKIDSCSMRHTKLDGMSLTTSDVIQSSFAFSKGDNFEVYRSNFFYVTADKAKWGFVTFRESYFRNVDFSHSEITDSVYIRAKFEKFIGPETATGTIFTKSKICDEESSNIPDDTTYDRSEFLKRQLKAFEIQYLDTIRENNLKLQKLKSAIPAVTAERESLTRQQLALSHEINGQYQLAQDTLKQLFSGNLGHPADQTFDTVLSLLQSRLSSALLFINKMNKKLSSNFNNHSREYGEINNKIRLLTERKEKMQLESATLQQGIDSVSEFYACLKQSHKEALNLQGQLSSKTE